MPGAEDFRLRNPILLGFNPDPSICRVGPDFYCTTSSFQWWPGTPIYHSRDLREWELISYALTDCAYLDMKRIGDSGGVWAPCLSYADGLFWLVFTNASGSRMHFPECANYLMTSPNPTGPWSPPVYLNASGNDPSLFHDDDGRKWLVNTRFDRVPNNREHSGTLLQEYSVKEKRLVGPSKLVFEGTGLCFPEGSKLFKRAGWYYLVIAEGGTEYDHLMTMGRSRDIWGPYEIHPENPLLTARDTDSPIQRAGHGDIVDIEGDRVAVVYLASRPVGRRSLLGRETFIASGRWHEDGWLRLDSKRPELEVPDFGLPASPKPLVQSRDDFDLPRLGLEWNSLRGPIDDRIDLQSRPGRLGLKPTPTFLDSVERPSLIAQRIRHHQFSAETELEFIPREPMQWAGLTCYYDTRHWYFLHLHFDAAKGVIVSLCSKQKPYSIETLGEASIRTDEAIRLGVTCDGSMLQFRFAQGDTSAWTNLADPQDALVLSDEFVEEHDAVRNFGFTGSFIGLAAFDITERGDVPYFDWFQYEGLDTWPEFLEELPAEGRLGALENSLVQS